MQGQVTRTTLASGATSLWEQGYYGVAALVFLATILAPAIEIFLIIYVFAPIHFGRVAPGTKRSMRAIAMFRPLVHGRRLCSHDPRGVGTLG